MEGIVGDIKARNASVRQECKGGSKQTALGGCSAFGWSMQL